MFFYSLNGQRMGPVPEEQLRRMVSSGELKPETLIWREGMTDWQPFAMALGSPLTGTVQCTGCKQSFPSDQTIRIAEATVCAACKPRHLQSLREGVANDRGKSLYAIAINQRRTLLCFGVLIVCNLAQVAMVRIVPAAALLIAVVSLAAMLCGLIFVYRLAKCLGFTAIIYAIAMIIPCINLLTLLVVISRATKALQASGVKVGLFGVSRETMEKLRAV